MITPVSALISSRRSKNSGSADRGTHTSSNNWPPPCARANVSNDGCTIRRVAMRSSESRGSSLTATSRAEFASATRAKACTSAGASVPFDCIMSMAPTVASSPKSPKPFNISMVVASISSMSEGTKPSAMNCDTVRAAATSFGKVATAVSGAGGSGITFNVASTITPSVPSDPTNSEHRSNPATPFAVLRPSRVSVPSGRTTLISRTKSCVTPYRTQHKPPALVAMFPPMVDSFTLPGSGG